MTLLHGYGHAALKSAYDADSSIDLSTLHRQHERRIMVCDKLTTRYAMKPLDWCDGTRGGVDSGGHRWNGQYVGAALWRTALGATDALVQPLFIIHQVHCIGGVGS